MTEIPDYMTLASIVHIFDLYTFTTTKPPKFVLQSSVCWKDSAGT